jgi:serine protease Do
MDDLIAFGEVRRGSIGYIELAPVTTQLAGHLQLDNARGALVSRMRRDSEAYAAGIRPGDVIVAFDGHAVDDPSHLLRLISDSPIGSEVRIRVMRAGEVLTLEVKIAQTRGRRPV